MKSKKDAATSLFFATGREHAITSSKIGVSHYDLRDPYHFAMDLSWRQFGIGLTVIYVLINVLFAALYCSAPGAIANLKPGAFLDAFFSVSRR